MSISDFADELLADQGAFLDNNKTPVPFVTVDRIRTLAEKERIEEAEKLLKESEEA